MDIVLVLAVLVIIPFLLLLVGIIELFSSNPAKKKRARNLILAGISILLLEILIGYSICSNIRIGGMH